VINFRNFFNWINPWLYKNKRLWLHPLIIIGILAICATLPLTSSLRNLQLLLVMLIGIGLILFLLSQPQIGILMLIPASLVFPFEINTGTETGVHAGVLFLSLLIGLWIIDMLISKRKFLIIPSRTITPLMIFMVVVVLSFFTGQLSWFSTAAASIPAQVVGVAIFFLSAGAFLLAAHNITDVRWLEWLTWTFLIFGGLYIFGQIVPGFNSITRIFQNGTYNQSIFWLLIVTLSASQAMFNKRLHLIWRLLLGGLAAVTLLENLNQTRFWLSGWMPALVSLTVIVWVGIPRLRGFLALGIVGVIFINNKLFNFVLIGDNNAFTLSARFEAYQIVLNLAKSSLIFGLGPANYYWYTSLIPIMGYYVPINSHNNYIDIIAQTGIVGLVCFLWFIWEIGRLSWRLLDKAPKDGFDRAYILGGIGLLVGLLVAAFLGDWVLPFIYNVGLRGFRSSALAWLFLGGLVALEHIYHHSSIQALSD